MSNNRVSRITTMFATSSSVVDFCKQLVHDEEFNGKLVGTQLYSLTNRGSLVSVGFYGQEVFPELDKIALFEQNPIADAVSKKEVVVVEYANSEDLSVWAMPILKDKQPVGALVSLSRKDAQIEMFDDSEMIAIANVAYLYLEAVGANRIVNNNEEVATGELTDRQYDILLYMAKGLTNQAIADQLILSESSIKQETVKIYKALGVGSRQDAVKKSKLTGLIPDLVNTSLPRR